MCSTLKTILNYHDWMNQVLSMTKIRHENDMIDHTGAIYAKNNTKLSWPIRSGANCDENQIRQLHDQSYRCGLH